MPQVQVTRAPDASRPLAEVNQKRRVIAGLMMASNTSATGRWISMPAEATGAAMAQPFLASSAA
jgi:hypothetical protein